MKPELRSIAQEIFGKSFAEYTIPRLEDFEKYFKEYYRDASGTLTERVLSAILKIAETNPEKIDATIQLAKSDWRDALVGAGFENDINIHLKWIKERNELR